MIAFGVNGSGSGIELRRAEIIENIRNLIGIQIRTERTGCPGSLLPDVDANGVSKWRRSPALALTKVQIDLFFEGVQ